MRDEHCHIVFGVDDGSPDLETSIAMLDAAKDAGITELWATPHLRWSDFDRGAAERHYAQVREEASSRGIQMKLGYEVYYKTLLKLGLERAPEFVLEGTRQLLLECNSGEPLVEGWDRTVYQLQSRFGLEVVWAHPERYITVHKDFSTVERMVDMGCRVQVSAGDLFAGLLSPVARAAKRIVAEGLCDALVSDAHAPDQYDAFKRACAKYGR